MIMLTGDCHGQYDYEKFNFLKENPDYMIVCGDWGLPWKNEGIKDFVDETLTEYYSKKKYVFLIVPGNHENYKRIFSMQLVDIGLGDLVHKYIDNIYYLQRGHIYTIEGKTFLAIGGALSIDKDTNPHRIVDIGWWEEELLTYKEEHDCLNLLNEIKEVDYVITHTAPKSILEKLVWRRKADALKLKDPVSEFLDVVKDKITFKHWYFGHIHESYTLFNFQCLYKNFVKLED